jgi:hypothetical protein
MKVPTVAAAIFLLIASRADARNSALVGTMSLETTPGIATLNVEADALWRTMFSPVTLIYGYRLGERLARPWHTMNENIALYATKGVAVTKERCGVWPGDLPCTFLYGRFYKTLPKASTAGR